MTNRTNSGFSVNPFHLADGTHGLMFQKKTENPIYCYKTTCAHTQHKEVTHFWILGTETPTQTSISVNLSQKIEPSDFDMDIEEFTLFTTIGSYYNFHSSTEGIISELIFRNIKSKNTTQEEIMSFYQQSKENNELSTDLLSRMAEEIHIEIYKEYPALLKSPLLVLDPKNVFVTTQELLRSIHYTHPQFFQEDINYLQVLTETQLQKPYYIDIFTIISTEIAKNNLYTSHHYQNSYLSNENSRYIVSRHDPLTIIHLENPIIELSNIPELVREIKGQYKSLYNVVSFADQNVLFHELTHATMSLLFNNHSAPYNDDASNKKNIYTEAINQTLRNVAFRLNEEHFSKINWNHDTTSIIKSIQQKIDLVMCSLEDTSVEFRSATCNKYFPDHETFNTQDDDVLQTLIRNELGELNLVKEEETIMSVFFHIINHYHDSQIHSEFIAYFAGLIEEFRLKNMDTKYVMHFFAPMAEYWDKEIHPLALQKQQENINFCYQILSETDPDAMFNYCITDFLKPIEIKGQELTQTHIEL